METVMLVSAWMVLGAAASHAHDVPAGRLGHPLGSYLTIGGVRAEAPGKGAARVLLVDDVNGRRLREPVAVAIDNAGALPAGKRCVFRGYENGKMIGTPPAVLEAAKETGREIPLPQAGWQFYRYFTVLSVVEPKDLRPQPAVAPVVTPRAVGPAQQARNREDPGPAGRDPSIAWNLAAGFMARQSFAGDYSEKGSAVFPVAGVPDTYDVRFDRRGSASADGAVVVRVDIKKQVCTLRGGEKSGAASTREPGAISDRGSK